MLYALIILGVVVACIIAIHLAFDARQRGNVKRWFASLFDRIKKALRAAR